VVQVSEELIEAMHRREKLVQVTKVVLAELACRIALRLQGGSERYRLRWAPNRDCAASFRPVRIGNSPVMKTARAACFGSNP
jgi:hypothetical protein